MLRPRGGGLVSGSSGGLARDHRGGGRRLRLNAAAPGDQEQGCPDKTDD